MRPFLRIDFFFCFYVFHKLCLSIGLLGKGLHHHGTLGYTFEKPKFLPGIEKQFGHGENKLLGRQLVKTAKNGQLKIVEQLLKDGAAVNFQNQVQTQV